MRATASSIAWLPATYPRTCRPFLRTEEALNEIEYLGPEPDRWRSPAEPELNAAQAPEHFIDLEPADALGPLPHHRLDFEAEVFAAGERPEKIGLQPWETDEVWERLKAAFREYRHLSAAGQDTRPVEQAVIFYAGWLGHYVGDGSQPLHTTIQYNGWVGPNPNGYTTSHQIHWQFEGPFVAANIHEPDVQAKMTPSHAIDGDIFDCIRRLFAPHRNPRREGLSIGEGRRICGLGNARIARLCDCPPRRRSQHVARHDLLRLAW